MIGRVLLRSLLLALSALCLAPLVHCSSSSSGDATSDAGATLGSACGSDGLCPPPYLCSYPADGGCDARGTCTPEMINACTDGPTVCGCDGTPVPQDCTYGAGRSPLPIPSLTPGCAQMTGDGGG